MDNEIDTKLAPVIWTDNIQNFCSSRFPCHDSCAVNKPIICHLARICSSSVDARGRLTVSFL